MIKVRLKFVLLMACLMGYSFSTAAAQTRGIWLDPNELASLPTSGTAWQNVLQAASRSCSTPQLSNQDDPANVCVMAKALVYARTGQVNYRVNVVDAIWAIVNSGSYSGRALALGREIGAYAIAADLINLRGYDAALDDRFRSTLRTLLTTPTSDGPSNLIDCHESRPNNWGTHCGGARAAIAAYLGDTAQLARTAQVFKGWLGDRSSYAGFEYGESSWQCDPANPVGINPAGCTKSGRNIDGVLPDDQRRAGTGFTWPPPKENYVYEGLQGALAQAVILKRAGYDVFAWQDRALLRAFKWLYNDAAFPAANDDTWQPFIINYFYGKTLPTSSTSSPGKNVGWTDWTHGGSAGSTPPPPAPPASPVISASPSQLSFAMTLGGTVAPQSVRITSSGSWTATVSNSRFSVSPSSGSGDATITVTPSASGLTEGNFTSTLTITAPGATGSPISIALSLSVTAGSTAARLSGLSASPTTLTGGASSTGTVLIANPSPTSSMTVSLRSSVAAVTVPASVTVAAGASSATFPITTTAVTSTQQAIITATLGTSLTATLTVNPAATTPPPATPPPTGTTGRLPAAADAYVRGGDNVAKNYGSASTLDVKDGNDASNDRRAYLRFNLGSTASVTSATLQLNVSVLDGATSVCVHAAGDGWLESSLTWNTAPPAGAQASCRPITALGTVSFDVTSLVKQELQGDRVVSFVLQDAAAGNQLVRFSSREAGSAAPVLEIK